MAAASEHVSFLQTSLDALDSLAVPWSCTCSEPTPHSSEHDAQETVNDAIHQQCFSSRVNNGKEMRDGEMECKAESHSG
jgi:hypothetical protein